MSRLIFIFSFALFTSSCENSTTNPPIVSTIGIFNTYANYIDIRGEIVQVSGSEIIDHGFVWSETSDPKISNAFNSLGPISIENQFDSRIQGLKPNTTYYFKAYIKNIDDEITYGEELSAKTLAENSWIQKSDFENGVLVGAATFVINDTLFIGAGFGDSYSNIFYKYNLHSDTWDLITNLPSHSRHNPISFTINGYGYVGLGSNCTGTGLCNINYFKDLWRYNPTNNSWSRMMDYPGSPRDRSTVFVIGDKAYVTGGGTADQSRVMWEYDSINNVWTQKADYPGFGSHGQIAFSFNGFGYIGFGFHERESFNDFWMYDPINDIWDRLEDFPGEGRTESVYFQTNLLGYVLGGVNFQRHQSDSYLNDFWKFNPVNQSWEKIITEYPGKGRVHMSGGMVDNRIFVGIGSTSYAHSNDDRAMDIWEYIPVTSNE